MTLIAPSISTEWVGEVAERLGLPENDVRDILNSQRVSGPRVLPARRRLKIEAVHFSGQKDIAGELDRTLVPFAFTHEFTHSVTAFATKGKNDAGKSSILHFVLWGLRGVTDLQSDVMAWTKNAALCFRLGEERLLVSWSIIEGVATGAIHSIDEGIVLDWSELQASSLSAMQGGNGEITDVLSDWVASIRGSKTLLASFDKEAPMNGVLDDLMLTRLGLSPSEVWTRAPKATESDDGKVVVHGWPLWSQALVIAPPGIGTVLGETPSLSQHVLQMYLGTTWGPALTSIRARRNVIDAELASVRRRRRNEEEAQKASVDELVDQLGVLRRELAALPSQATLDEIEAALGTAAQAADEYSLASEDYIRASLEFGSIGRELESAQADAHALREAAVTKRFWHALQPSCCPRCDAKVDESMWKREEDGHCSLCDSQIELETESPSESLSEDDETLDDLTNLEQRIAALETEWEVASAAQDAIKSKRDAAESRLVAARTSLLEPQADPSARREIEYKIAALEGRLEERSTKSVADADIDHRESIARVLEAAEAYAKERRANEQKALLEEVSLIVTDLGKRLGVTQLESAKLQGNSHLPVIKGGARHNFGNLTEGERLRLKVAVVIALLEVGTAAGVGRHPGLLVIDSIGREELNPADVRTLLTELESVAREHDVQVITSTTYGDIAIEALEKGAVVLPIDGEVMW